MLLYFSLTYRSCNNVELSVSFILFDVSGMLFTPSPRPLQMTNLPQGPQNPPVANMSNAQNSNGKSLLVQSQSMAMASNAQPMPQVPQQPFQQAYRPLRKKTIIKIIDPNTGREVDLNNSSQGPPVR